MFCWIFPYDPCVLSKVKFYNSQLINLSGEGKAKNEHKTKKSTSCLPVNKDILCRKKMRFVRFLLLVSVNVICMYAKKGKLLPVMPRRCRHSITKRRLHEKTKWKKKMVIFYLNKLLLHCLSVYVRWFM